jgi:hypothetical protein
MLIDDHNIQMNFLARSKLFILLGMKELIVVPIVFDQCKLISLSEVSNHPPDSEEKTRFVIAKEILALMSRSWLFCKPQKFVISSSANVSLDDRASGSNIPKESSFIEASASNRILIGRLKI